MPLIRYVKSSIWPGIKNHIHLVRDNSVWQIGNGNSISFWRDRWLNQSLVDATNIPDLVRPMLQASISDFILDNRWVLPHTLALKFLSVYAKILQVPIPTVKEQDYLIWTTTDSGTLTFKDAFVQLNPLQPLSPFFKLIWNVVIPPSRSFLVWQIIHEKLPIDENLRKRGCVIVSRCDLYGLTSESSDHLFFHCPFAKRLWAWLSAATNTNIDLSNCQSIFGICEKSSSSQVRDVLLAAIINIFWMIWHCRNSSRFQNQHLQLSTAINMIFASASLSGNLSKGHTSSSMDDFVLLKFFVVHGHPNRAPTITQVDWLPPTYGWLKCNTDGAAKGSPSQARGGGIFSDKSVAVLGCFALYFGISNSLHAELLAAMYAIELAFQKGWHPLWLECDSSLVVTAFSNSAIVPWQLQTRWKIYLQLTTSMRFRISHIFREENTCVDKLANFGVSSCCNYWWDLIPNFIREDFLRNRISLPNFRLRSF